VVILWWLAPPVVATLLAMLWVSWLGRAGRGEVDREVAVRRLGDAISRPARVRSRTTPTRATLPGERSTGVAVRPSSKPQQRTPSASGQPSTHPADEPSAHPAKAPGEPGQTRRAS
jgi:hypothetical protein